MSGPLATGGSRPGWGELGIEARAFRVAHAAWAVGQLASLGHVAWCARTGRPDRLLPATAGFLVVEGVALIIGRGDCPFGPAQTRLGDPTPLFELILPRRAARAAVPVLTAITLGTFVACVMRMLRLARRNGRSASLEGP